MANKLMLGLCIALLLGGCMQQEDSGSNRKAADGSSYDGIYAEAADALAEAEARRSAWSKTEMLLQDSKVAFTEGRMDDAISLATEAKLQAQLALEQADTEEATWRSRVMGD